MKKLLALVLCVMLFISIVPTAAFATTPKSAGEIIAPAYEAMNKLYNTLRTFDAVSKVAGLYNGFVKAYPDAFKTPEGMNALNTLKKAYNAVKADPNEGATQFGLAIGAVYETVGDYIIDEAETKYTDKTKEVITASETTASNILTSASTALAAAMS